MNSKAQDTLPNAEVEPVIVNEDETEPLLNKHKQKPNSLKKSPRRIGEESSEPIYMIENESQQNNSQLEEYVLQPNLKKIYLRYKKFRRYSSLILNVCIFVNILWLIFTLVTSYFFSFELQPIIHKRYSGYNDLCIITISIISNCLNLWSNNIEIYSHLDFDLNIILFALTIFNLMLLKIVRYTSERIGIIGVITYAWAATTFGIGILLDWKTANFKKQIVVVYNSGTSQNDNARNINSSRATSIQNDSQINEPTNSNSLQSIYVLPVIGNSQNTQRHTLQEWTYIFVKVFGKLLLLMYMIFFTLNTLLSIWDLSEVTKNLASNKQLKNPENLDGFYWVDKEHTYQLHIKCYGDVFKREPSTSNYNNNIDKLQPIILYEHGGFDTEVSSAAWLHELFVANEIDRYCTYDRPGYGLSDASPALQSISTVINGLGYALTQEANITGPFLCVGYDIGGLYSQVFAGKYNDKTAGLLLIDSWHENLLIKDNIKHILSKDKLSNSHKELPISLQPHTGLTLFFDGLKSTLGLTLQYSWLFRSKNSNDRIFGDYMRFQGKFLRAKFLEKITSSLLSYQDILEHRQILENTKLAVVTSKELVKKSLNWGIWQRELSKISGKTKEWKMVDGGHEIYLSKKGINETKEVLLRLLASS
ncbi:hypothetical protein TPHA_0F01830 [Tetrapisispora phaffii CBS 4417]|uniref:AB hydrolase-1 domain-containing protein n=1 Tax=Tetrapisispora phaffii (strain ATCC 24235 / CBS 4417 / NBRC 1672 / NRRL Y-8282 / UCD 70-5) TaxID=1071381 RepID=G8BV84_TETPH|nr:hypothetical protein TPHA_0F01830 [Tetrapisispora phaffii CBS 4417]CCE63666.1 hypothetical protein TPHA_0F01830 [Tetrapisispora phaffii CBS 4417]